MLLEESCADILFNEALAVNVGAILKENMINFLGTIIDGISIMGETSLGTYGPY